jgi:hypothetical protein
VTKALDGLKGFGVCVFVFSASIWASISMALTRDRRRLEPAHHGKKPVAERSLREERNAHQRKACVMSDFALPRSMRLVLILCLIGVCLVAQGHDFITTKLTWNREISRIVYTRCAGCHRQNGSAFPLMSYQEARPWAKAIEEEVLERRMPPWGAVKGFGDFRNDQALTQEQLELIANWVEGGAPEGDPKDLPPEPRFPTDRPIAHRAGEIVISGAFILHRPFRLDGFWPKTVPDTVSLQITAELPDGGVKPLLWLYDYKIQYGHPFLLRTPLDLPPGTVIRGVTPGSSLVLLPAIPARAPVHQSVRYSGHPSAGTAPKSDMSAHAERSY